VHFEWIVQDLKKPWLGFWHRTSSRTKQKVQRLLCRYSLTISQLCPRDSCSFWQTLWNRIHFKYSKTSERN